MSLSSELIAQFVKATNDEKKETTETTVYGTTVESDGVMYVQLDGSDLLTPVSTTTVAVPGERVMVMVKNHTATIIGNITTPSARATVSDDLNYALTKMTRIETKMVSIESTVGAYDDDIEALQRNVMNLSVDYITETGTKDIWTYEKWNSGKIECWGRYTATGVNASANNLDGLYRSEAISVPLPVTFTEVPVVLVDGGDPTHMQFVREFGSTTANAVFVVMCNSSTQTSTSINVSIHVIGK